MASLAPTLTGTRLGFWALGGFGTGILTTVPSVLLLFFCTEVLAMPPALAALTVLLPKLWAMVWDPVVGAWSDRTQSRLGRRRPFILAGAVGVPLFFMLLFCWPYAQGSAAFLTITGFYLLMTSSYSIFAVPYVAIPAEASSDPLVRERITGWRIGFAMIGVLAGASLGPAVAEAAGGGRHGYAVMAVVIAVLCAAAMASTFFATPSRFAAGPVTAAPREPFRMSALCTGTSSFWRLVLVYLLLLLAAGLVTALTPYWIVHVALRPVADTALALGVMFLATIATVPVWMRAIARWGAAPVLLAAAIGMGAGTLMLAFPVPGLLLPLFAVLGVPFAGIQVAAFALVAHAIHNLPDERRGLFTGIWTAGEKIGLALGAGFAGFGLQLGGFVSAASVQTPEAVASLGLLIAFGPLAFIALSVIMLIFPRRT